jgi:hypothetical protein
VRSEATRAKVLAVPSNRSVQCLGAPLKTSHIEQYWRELTDGNFGMCRFMILAARGFIMEIARRVGLLKPLPLRGPGRRRTGAWPSEIAATLNRDGKNRGLSFDRDASL